MILLVFMKIYTKMLGPVTKTGSVRINVTLRRVSVTISAVEEQYCVF
jgi:hypothetical protein